MLSARAAASRWFFALLAAALAFGVLMVMPIGGADMPVVISLLNSFTGLAAAATGFVLHNTALIIAGTLVGASGTLLTQLMCKAMNRSLGNVLFGGFGAAPAGRRRPRCGGPRRASRCARSRPRTPRCCSRTCASLIIVPGYGMAVAQAQHAVRELADLLAKRGVEVKYAIHPVAGRMPGHMNVLLAEANVPYTQLFDLDADQRRVRAHRRGAGDRRERRGEPGRAHRQDEPDLRHADPRRRQGAARASSSSAA